MAGKWLSQSSDLSPVEHHWDVMEWEIDTMDVQPTNLTQTNVSNLSVR